MVVFGRERGRAARTGLARRTRHFRRTSRAQHGVVARRCRSDVGGGVQGVARRCWWRRARARRRWCSAGGSSTDRRVRSCRAGSVRGRERMSSFVQAATGTNRCSCVWRILLCRCPAGDSGRHCKEGLRRTASLRALRPPTQQGEAPPCVRTRTSLPPSLPVAEVCCRRCCAPSSPSCACCPSAIAQAPRRIRSR
jgi:hypothetical protein